MTKDFEFVDQGRTFFCTLESPRHAGMRPWWWFRLDGDLTTRYAPFEQSPDDTQQSVKQRVIAYYAELLAIKARPVHPRPQWNRPGSFQKKPEAPVE
ncbi:MAG TPA: hypothetical protein VGC52_09110 [Gemmatimonadaceae bacterium]